MMMSENFTKDFNERYNRIFGSGSIKRFGPITADESTELCYFILQIAKKRLEENNSIEFDSHQDKVFFQKSARKIVLNNLGVLMLGWYSDDTVKDLLDWWPRVGRGNVGNGPVLSKDSIDKDCEKMNCEGGPFVYETLMAIKSHRGSIDELIIFVGEMFKTVENKKELVTA